MMKKSVIMTGESEEVTAESATNRYQCRLFTCSVNK